MFVNVVQLGSSSGGFGEWYSPGGQVRFVQNVIGVRIEVSEIRLTFAVSSILLVT